MAKLSAAIGDVICSSTGEVESRASRSLSGNTGEGKGREFGQVGRSDGAGALLDELGSGRADFPSLVGVDGLGHGFAIGLVLQVPWND